MLITIRKWKDKQPRSDYKSMPWLRVDNDIGHAKRLFGLGPDQKWVWVCLMGLAAQANENGRLEIEVGYLAAYSGCTEPRTLEALKHFERKKLADIQEDSDERTSPVREPNVSRASAEATLPTTLRYEHNERNEHNEHNERTLSPRKRARRPVADPPDEADLTVGREWLEHGLREMPWKRKDPGWTPERFGEQVAQVRRAIGATPGGMAEILGFVRRDDFWRKNACTPKGLLKRSDRNGERKIDNILVRMRSNASRQVDGLREWAKGGQDGN